MLESWPGPPTQSILSSWMELLHAMLYMMLYHLVIFVGAAVGSYVPSSHFEQHNAASGGIFASIYGCEKNKAPASTGHMKRSLGTYIYIYCNGCSVDNSLSAELTVVLNTQMTLGSLIFYLRCFMFTRLFWRLS